MESVLAVCYSSPWDAVDAGLLCRHEWPKSTLLRPTGLAWSLSSGRLFSRGRLETSSWFSATPRKPRTLCTRRLVDQPSGNGQRPVLYAKPKWRPRRVGCLPSKGRQMTLQSRVSGNYTAVMIVPTGTAASVGGYAGDALPAARLLASVCDTLVTHPNVLNGAMLYWPIPNALYVEGHALDRFCEGIWGLEPRDRPQNRLGVVFDAAIPPRLRERHLQVCDAVRATLGIQVVAYTVTRQPVVFRCGIREDGSSYGIVESPNELIEAAASLLEPPHDCDALAVVCYFSTTMFEHASEMLESYRQGKGVDPIGGAEAALSHAVTAALGVPCAHAPALDESLNSFERSNPKSAAEELGFTFLPCVLAGLAQAPRLVPHGERSRHPNLRTHWVEDVDALVAPGNALNGPAVQAMLKHRALVIAVRENVTCLNATPLQLPVNVLEIGPNGRFIQHERDARAETPWILWVRSYAEAAGYLVAHREGLLFDTLSPSVPPILQVPTKPLPVVERPARQPPCIPAWPTEPATDVR